MERYPNEIVEFLRNYDIEFNKKNDINVAIINTNLFFIDIFRELCKNIFYITELTKNNLEAKYPELTVINGTTFNTNLGNRSIDYILINSEDFELISIEKQRTEHKRIRYNEWSDSFIIQEKINLISDFTNELNNFITKNNLKNSFINKREISNDKLFKYFGGSGFENKRFVHSLECNSDNLIKLMNLDKSMYDDIKLLIQKFSDNDLITLEIETILFYNSIGYNKEDLSTKNINYFIEICEKYCNLIENFKNYTKYDFLFNIQKCLSEYYFRGFSLPETSGSTNNDMDNHSIKTKLINNYTNLRIPDLIKFLGESDIYFSNFNPCDKNDIEIFGHSLTNDLYEIYEDIKSNLIVFKTNNIFNQQETLWQLKFDWKGHTGDHLTFALRSIHWMLQGLEN